MSVSKPLNSFNAPPTSTELIHHPYEAPAGFQAVMPGVQ